MATTIEGHLLAAQGVVVGDWALQMADIEGGVVKTVTTDDIAKVAHPVLRHRILTTFSAEAAGMSSDKLIDRLLKEVPRKSE